MMAQGYGRVHPAFDPASSDTGITQLTGDVTAGPGSGSQAATIAARAVTFAKLQAISTSRVLGRLTAGSGDVEELTITGTGNVVFSASPTLSGTALAEGITMSGRLISSVNGALSAPAVSFTGTPITGGTTTTTKPLVLIETAGATSAAWNTNGTMFGVNAPSLFAGSLASFQVNGVEYVRLSSAGVRAVSSSVIADRSVQAGAQLRIGSDAILERDAANTLALRNSTNAQTFRVYNTYTDASNYERGVFDWTSVANELSIGTQKAGTGVNRGIYFLIGGSAAWRISSSGHFLGATDNTYDIGASGATRPRTGYFGTDVIAGGAIQSGTYLAAGSYVQLASGSPLIWNSRSRVSSPNDGVLTLFNAAQADFSRLQFGGTGATAPALKRSSAILQTRLADDSDYAAFEADTIRTAKARTVAQLPAAGSAGRRAYVTDANATTYLSIVAGGGANVVPVFDNGTNWVIA